MAKTVDDGLDWLTNELAARKMNREDLERDGGPQSASLANAYRKKMVGRDLATQIATGLGLPPEVVYREFGILPEKQTVDDEEAQILADLLNDISDPGKRRETFSLVTTLLRHVAAQTQRGETTDRSARAGKKSRKAGRAATGD